MSRKVELELKVKIYAIINEGTEVVEVVDNLDFCVIDTTTAADILFVEVLDHEVIDSK